MKKTAALLIMLILLAGMCTSCNPAEIKDDIEDLLTVTETAPTEEKPVIIVPRPENLPAIDGSTTMIPLASGIRSLLLDITDDEAMAGVIHNGTYHAFYNLLDGECDVILTAPISPAQQQLADEYEGGEVDLEIVPITRDGFVFLINAANPVKSLTIEQIKDIYAGKITNWKEVGGNDAPIYAYQRNEDSGSQNFIVKLMGDTPLMKPVTASTPGSMTGLIEVIAAYDNAVNAIGYSFYSYAVDMNRSNNIKLVEVNGVVPSKATMADGTYPLTDDNYAIFDKNSPNAETTRLFVDWLISDEGQRLVADSGYIAAYDIDGYEYKEVEESSFYSAVGTGMRKPEDFTLPTHRYFAYMPYTDWANFGTSHEYRFFDEVTPEVTNYENTMAKFNNHYDYPGVKDQALRAEITDFINTSFDEIMTEENVSGYYERMYEAFEFVYDPPFFRVESECLNGYLSIAVYLFYDNGTSAPYECYYDCRTAVYDITTGKKLSFSDLFYNNAPFVPIVNSALIHNAGLSVTDFGMTREMKGDFVGLPADFEYFTLDTVIFPYGNEYFSDGVKIRFADYPGIYDYYIPAQPRDFSDYVVDDPLAVDVIYDSYIPRTMIADGVYFHGYAGLNDDTEAVYGSDFTLYRLKRDTGYIENDIVDKVNDFMYNYILTTQTRDVLLKKINDSGMSADVVEEIHYGWNDWGVSLDFDTNSIVYENWFYEAYYINKQGDYCSIPTDVMEITSRFTFDMETGEVTDEFLRVYK
jgi:ABC-type phosphate transport system, periplasmic component